jgi:hypothetical protein
VIPAGPAVPDPPPWAVAVPSAHLTEQVRNTISDDHHSATWRFFGTVAAAKFSNQQAELDCGSTTLAKAVSPAGKADTKVKVTVTTVESDFTGSGHSSSTAFFSYDP